MKTLLIGLVAAVAVASGVARAADHPCAADAKTRGERLLRFNYADGGDPAEIQNVGVDEAVKQLAPIKALHGADHYDVLEVIGYVYKSIYRMHFIYAQNAGQCDLVGQEIIYSN